jgi:gluconokinase
MPASLVASQFQTLEPLAADEQGVTIDVDQDIDSIVETYLALSASRATEQETK